MFFVRNKILHPINCGDCCKSYCTNCYVISLGDIDSLVLGLENLVVYNSNNWYISKTYDFRDCFDFEKILKANVYINFLKRYRKFLITGTKVKLTHKQINHIIEQAKDLIDLCPEREESLSVDLSEYKMWAEKNPERAKPPDNEYFLPSDLKVNYTLKKEYGELTDYKISYNIYKELIKCELSHELIKEMLRCNMITTSSKQEDNCVLNINNNSYELCDIKVNGSVKEKMVNALIETKII